MAAPIPYGEIQVATVNGKVKLMCNITPRVKIAVNTFDINKEIYVHLNAKSKSVSMMLSDFEEVCGFFDTLKQKLYLLEEVSLYTHYICIHLSCKRTGNLQIVTSRLTKI